LRKHFLIAIATGLYSGFIRPWSGTFGTIPAWLLAYFVLRGDTLALAIAVGAGFILAVWSAGEAEKIYGHDAKRIVIDEWVGMFVTLLLMPYTLKHYLVAFFAFRFFDVGKFPPASHFERLPGGWGVTMDDVMAGVYANVATQFALYALQRWYGLG
jgi:phosphatidylglycerophosphatase A